MSFRRSSGSREQKTDLGDLTLVRLSTHGKRLEMVVHPENAWLYKQGEDIPVDDVVEGYVIFENFSRSLKATTEELVDIFGTNDEKKMAEMMIQKGELLITAEQRKQFLAEKREEIIAYISTHAVNPKTKTPHPPARIEKAIDDAGAKINRNDPAADQAVRIIKEINQKQILSIEIQTATIEFIVTAKDTGKFYGILQGSGDVIKEDWGTDGTLTMIIRVPAGVVGNILEKISDLSKGRVRSTVIDRAG